MSMFVGWHEWISHILWQIHVQISHTIKPSHYRRRSRHSLTCQVLLGKSPTVTYHESDRESENKTDSVSTAVILCTNSVTNGTEEC